MSSQDKEKEKILENQNSLAKVINAVVHLRKPGTPKPLDKGDRCLVRCPSKKCQRCLRWRDEKGQIKEIFPLPKLTYEPQDICLFCRKPLTRILFRSTKEKATNRDFVIE